MKRKMLAVFLMADFGMLNIELPRVSALKGFYTHD